MLCPFVSQARAFGVLFDKIVVNAPDYQDADTLSISEVSILLQHKQTIGESSQLGEYEWRCFDLYSSLTLQDLQQNLGALSRLQQAQNTSRRQRGRSVRCNNSLNHSVYTTHT